MYQVLIEKRARKSLLKISRQDQARVIKAIQNLKDINIHLVQKSLLDVMLGEFV